MDEKIKLAINGYNKEKLVLAGKLDRLGSGNKSISTRSSIEERLTQIDKQIADLIHPPTTS